MEKTRKPTTAGILDLVAGAFGGFLFGVVYLLDSEQAEMATLAGNEAS